MDFGDVRGEETRTETKPRKGHGRGGGGEGWKRSREEEERNGKRKEERFDQKLATGFTPNEHYYRGRRCLRGRAAVETAGLEGHTKGKGEDWRTDGGEAQAEQHQQRQPNTEEQKKAFWHFLSSAKVAHPNAQYMVAVCLRHGIGTQLSIEGSLKWLERAAKNGSKLAALDLAKHHLKTGDGGREKEAYRWLRAAAVTHADGRVDPARRDARVLFELGTALLNGRGGAQEDPVEAAELLRAAAEEGHVEAMATLAFVYQSGHGVAADEGQALRWRLEAAALGHVRSLHLLGMHYLRQEPPEHQQALGCFTAAAQSGHLDSRFQLAQLILVGHDPDTPSQRAVELLSAAAQEEHLAALYVLGHLCYTGQRVQRDYSAAARLFAKGASLGHPGASLYLGHCLQNGRGVDQDTRAALLQYRHAAGLGSVPALFEVAMCLLHTGCGPEELREVVSCLHSAAEQGHGLSQNRLGLLYYGGYDELMPDPEQAVFWFDAAARQGVHSSQLYLGICYATGFGVQRDPVRAVELFEQSLQSTDPSIHFDVGFQYSVGQTVPRDRARALKLYHYAADNGHTLAMYFLAKVYLSGEELPRDRQRALSLLTVAAQLGHEKAASLLNLVKRNPDT